MREIAYDTELTRRIWCKLRPLSLRNFTSIRTSRLPSYLATPLLMHLFKPADQPKQ